MKIKYAIAFAIVFATMLCVVGYIKYLISVQVEKNAIAYARSKSMIPHNRYWPISRQWADIPLRDTDRFEAVADTVPYDVQLHSDASEDDGPAVHMKAGVVYHPPSSRQWTWIRVKVSDTSSFNTDTFRYGYNWDRWN